MNRFDLFTHIAILLLQFQLDFQPKTFGKFTHPVLDRIFAPFKTFPVKITDQDFDLGSFHISLYRIHMEKTFVTGSIFRHFFFRQTSHKLIGYSNRIDHFILRIPGMNIPSFENDPGISGIKILKFQFSDLSSIHRIGKLSPEFFYIKMIGPFPYFLIGSETDAYFTVFNFGVSDQIFGCGQNLGDSGFIVSTQQGIPICSDQCLPHIIHQFRKFLRRKYDSLLFVQHNIIARIILDNPGVHMPATHFGAGIHMGDKPDSRCFPFHSRRYNSHHIAEFIQFHLLDTYSFHLFLQYMGKLHLSRCTGIQSRIRV